MGKLDTHSYDGKLIDRLKNHRDTLKEGISLGKSISLEEGISLPSEVSLTENKIKAFDLLKEKINNTDHNLKATAMTAIDLIKNNIGTGSNVDPTNNLIADQILYILINKIKGSVSFDDISDVFITQLSDIITSGQCAQGRTTRLIQIYFSLFE